MPRRPLGNRAMTDAERQRRHREKSRPPWDAASRALDLMLEIEDRTE